MCKRSAPVLCYAPQRPVLPARRRWLAPVVGRPQVGKLGKKIAVGPYLVALHLPICDDSHKGVGGVGGERPAIAGKGCWARGVVAQEVRQQCTCHPPCFLRRIPPNMLQRVCEDSDETSIVRGRLGAIGVVLLASKERSLRRSCTAIRLNPAPARPVRLYQRAGP